MLAAENWKLARPSVWFACFRSVCWKLLCCLWVRQMRGQMMPLILCKSPRLLTPSCLRCLHCIAPGIKFLFYGVSAGVLFKLVQESCWS